MDVKDLESYLYFIGTAIKSLQTPRFIRLTCAISGCAEVINIKYIDSITEFKEDPITIATTGGRRISVKETPEEIMAMINGEAGE